MGRPSRAIAGVGGGSQELGGLRRGQTEVEVLGREAEAPVGSSTE